MEKPETGPLQDPAGSGSYAVTDTLGRSLSFASIPRRIVIAGRADVFLVDAAYLFPGVDDLIVGVGATDQGLGDFFSVLSPSSGRKARFANESGPEQIAAAHPDLVILKSYLKERLGEALSRIGIPVFYVDFESPDSFESDLQALGGVLRQPQRAASIFEYYDSRVQEVERIVAGAPRPTALVVQYSESGGTRALNVPPAGWIQTRLVETAGGNPVWKTANPGSGWGKTSFEQIAAWNPDYIFVVSYRTPAARAVEALLSSADWRQLKAAREGKILPFPADFLSWDQPDPRWILGLQWLASAIHPELSADFDLEREVASFFSELYNIPRPAVEAQIMSRLKASLGRAFR
jgi:iron complex transport system substrate-binding protein